MSESAPAQRSSDAKARARSCYSALTTAGEAVREVQTRQARTRRAEAEATDTAQRLRLRLQTAESDALIEGAQAEFAPEDEAALAKADSTIRASAGAHHKLAQQEADAREKERAARRAYDSAVLAWANARREEIRVKIAAQVDGVAKSLGELMGVELAQLELIGSHFLVDPSEADSQIWNGEIVARNFLKSVPSRLRSENASDQSVTSAAIIHKQAIMKELSI